MNQISSRMHIIPRIYRPICCSGALVCLALLLFPGSAVSQSTVEGVVVDAESGEALPGGTLQVAGTYTGTITNAAGRFTLRVASFPATIQVRFIGYQSTQVHLEAAPETDLTIRLTPSIIEMEGVTVSGEDPAIRIMRRVIEEKQRWRAGMETYSVDAYNRFRMENDTGIVSIWESFTRAFWDREEGMREVSIWQEQTRNMDISEVMPAAMFVQNLYDDDLEVAGHDLRGVTHPDALDHYRFRLVGTRSMDNRRIFEISVEPQARTGSGFVGTISVLDEAFALLSVDLTPGQAFLFPPPIQELTIRYRQQYSQFGGDPWLPVDMQSDIEFKVGLGGILDFPPFRIQQLSRLSDFEINVTLPDSLYEGDDRVRVDSTAMKAGVRPPDLTGVPLTTAESLAYQTIDSTMTIEKAFKPTGLLARFIDMDSDSDGSTDAGVGGNSGRSFGGRGSLRPSFAPDLLFNRVEGLHAGGTLGLSPKDWLELEMGGSYQTSRREWNRHAGIRLGDDTRLEITYGDGVVPSYTSEIRGRLLNSVTVLSGNADYFNYHGQRGWSGTLSSTELVEDLRVSATLVSENHFSVPQTVTGLLLGVDPELIPNPDVRTGSYRGVRARVEWDGDFIPYAIGPQRRIAVELEQSLSGDVAGDGFFVLQASGFWRFDTWFRRRLLPNNLDLRLSVQGARGDIPLQKMGVVDGSNLLTVFGALRTLKDRPYLGDDTVIAAWEHNFRTVPFELLHLDFLVERHLGLILHGGHGRTWLSRSSSGDVAVRGSGGWHHEVGVSLTGLFTVMRIDSTWRLDRPGFALGVSFARLF